MLKLFLLESRRGSRVVKLIVLWDIHGWCGFLGSDPGNASLSSLVVNERVDLLVLRLVCISIGVHVASVLLGPSVEEAVQDNRHVAGHTGHIHTTDSNSIKA